MSDFSAHHVNKPKTRDFPWGILLISLLFLSFLLWSKWDKLADFFSGSNQKVSVEDSGFVVGQSINLEGTLAANGDFMTHTHTLTTQSSGIFGLKSKTINLNQYTGSISIEGTVASQFSGMVIVDVISINDLNPVVSTGTLDTGAVSTGTTVITGTTEAPAVTTGTTQTSVTTSEVGAKNALSVQVGIQQVPVTIGTGIVFTSSRGHSILFPSKKISFSSINLAATNFGVKGLRCYAQTNVVEYTNKANITTSPSVKIFECTNSSSSIPSQFASVSLEDGRVFLIEATDPAWGNFANAIEISSVTPTTN